MQGQRILVTGSAGLVGTAISTALARRGATVVGLDLRGPGPHGDVTDSDAVTRAAAGCHGIVHLAAVSRVIWGEADPDLCWRTNAGGTRNVLDAARACCERPWVVVASSREVYGQPAVLPTPESAPLQPLNIYGRAKVEAEELTAAARDDGLRAAVARLSNVYGSVDDHDDRVIPAFAAGALRGGELRVDGKDHTFDFTHLDDTLAGLMALADLLAVEAPPPPIHFVTGTPTTLGELAALAIRLAKGNATVREADSRPYDVARFWGDPSRAKEILGWEARVPLEQGVSRLIAGFAHRAAPVAAATAL